MRYCGHMKKYPNEEPIEHRGKTVWLQFFSSCAHNNRIYINFTFDAKVVAKTKRRHRPPPSPNFQIVFSLTLLWKPAQYLNKNTRHITASRFQDHHMHSLSTTQKARLCIPFSTPDFRFFPFFFVSTATHWSTPFMTLFSLEIVFSAVPLFLFFLLFSFSTSRLGTELPLVSPDFKGAGSLASGTFCSAVGGGFNFACAALAFERCFFPWEWPSRVS